MHERGENECKIVVVRPEEMRPVGRPGSRLENFKMDIKRIGCGVEEWIYLAQERIQWRAIFYILLL
jgi:hypothetical protein